MRQSEKGLLLIVSGPAGVGKGTVNAELIKRHPEIRMSVSATTRKPRPGEIDGIHYFFKTQAEFEQMISENAFLEYMHVFGMNYYGTPKQFVVNELNQGHHVILEIDVQGAQSKGGFSGSDPYLHRSSFHGSSERAAGEAGNRNAGSDRNAHENRFCGNAGYARM